MLVYANGDPRVALGRKPSLDAEASLRLAGSLFPGERLAESGRGDLTDTDPPDNEIYLGQFGDVAVVAAREFGIDNPSRIAQHFLTAAPFADAYLHAMHSVVDWFALRNGSAGRSCGR